MSYFASFARLSQSQELLLRADSVCIDDGLQY
jgi:hypothetical protein